MSIKTRVKRLEQKSGSDWRVVIPYCLDKNRNTHEMPLSQDEVWGARFRAKGHVSADVTRRQNERYSDFEARAKEIAKGQYPGAIVMGFSAQYL